MGTFQIGTGLIRETAGKYSPTLVAPGTSSRVEPFAKQSAACENADIHKIVPPKPQLTNESHDILRESGPLKGIYIWKWAAKARPLKDFSSQ